MNFKIVFAFGRATLITVLLLVSFSLPARAQVTSIYAPSEMLAIDNGNADIRPFEVGPARLQQVYDASTFSPLVPSGGGYIRVIYFRLDPLLSGFLVASLVESMQVNMSTTAREPDGLSAVFSENTGLDSRITVGPRSVVLFGGTFVYMVLDDPFFYNPAQGNLLLDLQISKGIVPDEFPQPGDKAILDAFNVVGDSVSSVYGRDPFRLNMPTTGQPSSLGIATEFIVTPVPEPTTLGLLTVGLVLFGGMSWKRIRKG